MSLLRSTAVVGSLTLLSRIAGFFREILTAIVLGAGRVTDAFLIAFRFPNLFRRVFAEGAFNAAFVPLYSGKMETEGVEAADRLASETLAVLAASLFTLVIAATVLMPLLMFILAPGYFDDPDWRSGAILLAQIMMPYIGFMSLTAMFGGVLNARGRFAAFAFAPVLLNAILIAALIMAPQADCSPLLSEAACESQTEETRWQAALFLSVGVFVGGAAQLAFVWGGLWRQGVRLRVMRPRLTPDVKRVLYLGLPGAVAAGVTQINILVGQMIASLRESAVSWLAFSDRIYQLPLGIIGIAMGVALLPALSRRVKAGDEEGARQSLNAALELAALFTLPATAALLAAPEFFVKAVLEHGQFAADPLNTRNTALALAAYAAGLPGFIAIKVLAPAYFAREDTATPMRFAAISVAVNIVVGATLFFSIGRAGDGFVGLAMGTTIAGYVNALLLAGGLARRGQFEPSPRLASRLARASLASLVMGVTVWLYSRIAIQFLDENFLWDLTVAALLAAVGFGIYAAAAITFGAAKVSDVRAALRRS